MEAGEPPQAPTAPAGSKEARLDLEANVQEQQLKNSQGWRLWLLIYQSIGIVYGGLGTSPLYVFPNVFSAQPSPEQVLGAMSLVFWTLTIVVVFKYICLVLYANDSGEGGTFAMYSLLCRHARITAISPELFGEEEAASEGAKSGTSCALQRVQRPASARLLEQSRGAQAALLGVVLLGTAMMFCDGVLSPAASVISAMAGVQVVNPGLSKGAVAGISCVVLLALFAVQRFGTARLGTAFSPVLIAWFLFNGAVGVYDIAAHMPAVFKAVSPHYAVRFFMGDAKAAWVALGGVVLCISGSEALAADLGHFSRRAVTLATLAFVYPCLLAIYFGEAANLYRHPKHHAQAFYRAIPGCLFWPAFVIATAAALVGSQSLITSAFSVLRLSARLSCFPPLKVVHTGREIEGQVYVPAVNWALCLLGLTALAGFRDSAAIGNAFSVVVVFVMLITTLLVSLVMLVVWRWHPLAVLAVFAPLCAIDGVFLSAVLYQVPSGGWFPLVVAAAVLAIAALWHWGCLLRLRAGRAGSVRLIEDVLWPEEGSGSAEQGARREANGKAPGAEGTLQTWASGGRCISRVPGLAVFLADAHGGLGLPAGFVAMVESAGVVHHTVVFLTVALPDVAEGQRFEVTALGAPGCYAVLCRLGYADGLSKDAALIDALVAAIAEELRFAAMVAKWSAAEIHAGSPRRAAPGGSSGAGAALQLRKSGAHNRSSRCISVERPGPQPGQRTEEQPCGSGASEGQGAGPDPTEECSPAANWSQMQDRDSRLEFCADSIEERMHCEASGSNNAAAAIGSDEVRDSEQAGTSAEAGERAREAAAGASVRRRAAQQSEQRVQALLAARAAGVTFVTPRIVLRARSGSGWARRAALEGGFNVLQALAHEPNEAWRGMQGSLLELQVTCTV